jgi:hypothetical protein
VPDRDAGGLAATPSPRPARLQSVGRPRPAPSPAANACHRSLRDHGARAGLTLLSSTAPLVPSLFACTGHDARPRLATKVGRSTTSTMQGPMGGRPPSSSSLHYLRHQFPRTTATIVAAVPYSGPSRPVPCSPRAAPSAPLRWEASQRAHAWQWSHTGGAPFLRGQAAAAATRQPPRS